MAKAFNEYLNIAGIEPRSNRPYTYTGNVVGALELVGVDPSSLTSSRSEAISIMLGNIIQLLPINIRLTQYYIHAENNKVLLRDRNNSRSQRGSKQRQAFLNNIRKLNRSKLIWLIEIEPESPFGKVFSSLFLKNLFNSVFDEDARKKVKKTLSGTDSVLIDSEEFNKQCDQLAEVLSDINSRLSFISDDNVICDNQSIWKLQKFLATFNSDYLTSHDVATPDELWDAYALDGDEIKIVTYKGVDMLKIAGDKPVYVRLASIIKIGDKTVPYGAWAQGESSPSLARGNYVYFSRFKPMTQFKRELMLGLKSNELVRTQIRLKDLLSDSTSEQQLEDKVKGNSHLLKMREELDNISFSELRMGLCQVGVAVYHTDKDALIKTCSDINRRISPTMRIVWETVSLIDAYHVMQPCYPHNNYRAIQLNSQQMGAASLFYKSHTGTPLWDIGLNKEEEAFYLLESEDGVPFHYAPKVSERLLVIGNGATRSGKSFLKNCIASHFVKFGGLYSCLDVDEGSIPMANYFGEDGATFSLDEDFKAGFNLFSMAQSKDDKVFITHFIEQLKAMCAMNDTPSDKHFTPDEMQNITENIHSQLVQKFDGMNGRISVIRLSSLVSKCGTNIQRKLSMFVGDGIYASLFDSEIDAIGVINKPVAVYNLSAVKEKHDIAQLVHREIFFRVVRLFESPEYRTTPKFFEIDEAQYTLSVPHAAEFAIAKARTWFKHGGGMGFWTQNPEHYSNLPEWTTLRSSASVFIFVADPEATDESYGKAFDLTSEEVNLIRNLRRKQQIYIKIPALNIAKIVNLFVEPEQYAICTSKADEASMAREVWQQLREKTLTVDEAIEQIVDKLGKTPTKLETDEEINEVKYYAEKY
ncbi:VirB4 family type IV secretion system protein [Providencia rettgeri]|uniref:VirB4 family type IV secretion system protein n=1 Tax=Providencia rettgeri TaxID=587 RepID=UPI001FB9D073|nr:AAA family ATPase [Providencia rettgeri]